MLKTAGILLVIAFVGLMVSSTSEFVGKTLPFVESARVNTKQSNRVALNSMMIDFEGSAEAGRWYTVDDVVMGGVSQGAFTVTPTAVGIFSGELSLENNGGFSSVRRDIDGLGSVDAIALRVRGDGRRYQFRLKMDQSDRAPSYRAEFDTQPDEWLTITLPLQSFEPVFRGRIVENAPTLTAEEIKEIGFLLADKQEGEFRLEIDWIEGI
jgi:monofunctional biosynthetic peptidoglycan transglycosylase